MNGKINNVLVIAVFTTICFTLGIVAALIYEGKSPTDVVSLATLLVPTAIASILGYKKGVENKQEIREVKKLVNGHLDNHTNNIAPTLTQLLEQVAKLVETQTKDNG